MGLIKSTGNNGVVYVPVTVSGSTVTCGKTYAELKAFIDSGVLVALKDDNQVFYPTMIYSDRISFVYVNSSHSSFEAINIYSDGTNTITVKNLNRLIQITETIIGIEYSCNLTYAGILSYLTSGDPITVIFKNTDNYVYRLSHGGYGEERIFFYYDEDNIRYLFTILSDNTINYKEYMLGLTENV